jgi:putative aldouronate transport system permease protein
MKKGSAHNSIHPSAWESVFDGFNHLFMVVLMVIMVYPFMYVVFGSLSLPGELMRHSGLLLRPLGFTLNAYKTALKNEMVLIGFRNTFWVLIAGTSVNLIMTSLGAYALSRKGPMFIGAIMKMCVFTMFFSGGIIPSYLLVRNLNLLDTYAALILPGAISTTNMIIMRTAFLAIPDSLPESAQIDGAREWVILLRIILPLSMATVAVMFLYYGVGHWNSWFNASIYLQTRKKFPLQLVLREVLITDSLDDFLVMANTSEKNAQGDTLKYAMMIIATVPVLLIYPFLQRFFAKGVMIGAVKS